MMLSGPRVCSGMTPIPSAMRSVSAAARASAVSPSVGPGWFTQKEPYPNRSASRADARMTSGAVPANSAKPYPIAAPRLLLGREPEPGLEHQPDLLRGRAPERAPRNVVFGLDQFPVLRHCGVLRVGRGHVERPGPDPDDLGRRRVGALDPAPDLVPVLV